MSVDISFGICYGMIINDETASKISDRIEAGGNDDDLDNWSCRWIRCLNAWTGGDHFVGLINTLLDYDEGTAYLMDEDDLIINKEEEQDFLKIYNKYNLQDFFEWNPRTYAVSFVS